MIFEKSMGWHDEHIDRHPQYTLFFGVVAIAIYVLAINDKKKQLEGQMSWQQGFKSGLILTGLIAAFSPVAQYITSTFISPDYFSNAIEYSVENGLMNRGLAEQAFNLSNYMIQAAMGAVFTGRSHRP